MKKMILFSLLLGFAFAFPPGGFGYGGYGPKYGWGPGPGWRYRGPIAKENYLISLINTYPMQPLSEEEKESLKSIYEEEKLIRDLYISFYNKWQIPMFSKLSLNEEIYMDAIDALFKRYKLVNPLAGHRDDIGYFVSPNIKKLYSEFLSKGSKSLKDALVVCANVEEKRISDIEKMIPHIDNQDILFVYQNILKTARNHLRSLIYLLDYYGVNYVPKYISENEFKAIINTPMERGILDPNGKPLFWY